MQKVFPAATHTAAISRRQFPVRASENDVAVPQEHTRGVVLHKDAPGPKAGISTSRALSGISSGEEEE